jgi:UDP-2,3-diacylglucosamine hydrolase
MSPGRVAIICGQGRLPVLLAEALEAGGEAPLLATMHGFAIEGVGDRPVMRFRVERLAPFLDGLHEAGVTRVVFAGGLPRPRLEPELFDARSAQLVPRLVTAMQDGDDATLRAVVALFEEHDLTVVGADDVAPQLVPEAGVLGRIRPGEGDARDAARAATIVAALGAVDVGQGAVVAGGLCLAVEALPGTDAMLAQVAALSDRPPGGLLYKAPKPGQDWRVDLPALGPDTVARAARAGLAGIAFEAGGVLLLDRAATVAAADAAGLFLWSRAP